MLSDRTGATGHITLVIQKASIGLFTCGSMFQEQQERASTIISIFQVSACDSLAIVPLAKPRVSGKRGIPKGMAIGRY